MMKLNEPYLRQDFTDFIDQFLPDFEKDVRKASFESLGATDKVTYLGKSKKLDLQVFELTHKATSNARVALATDGFRIMKQSASFKALMVYRSDETDDWRLSLMTLTPEPNEKGKVKISFSNPRRYSFYLGPDAKVNTPYQLLIRKGKVDSFDDLKSRFSVEVVTDNFYKEYRGLFIRLTRHLQRDYAFQAFVSQNGIDTVHFAKKMLGQIVFLYFIQRKGWLGSKKGDLISNGDKNYLRCLFNKSRSEQSNFFNQYLEPLFYNALNSKPDKAGSFYRSYFNCQIPFLNGGLFEPLENYAWDKEYLHIPDELFSSNPDKPDEGNGILDVFDSYNFTVYENDPVDKEVSIDPEMLGQIFEKLGAITSESFDEWAKAIESGNRTREMRANKKLGIYYTPREIVHYMCRESLTTYLVSNHSNISEENINKYLDYAAALSVDITELKKTWEGESFTPGQFKEIEDLLQSIRMVDPACGSGAFLIGMLQQIVRLRAFLRISADMHLIRQKSYYDLKKETIQNCIYGVDIDPGATEIAKLRLWLSLVVDHELEDIEPLPNLDYKIMQGNSLLENLVIGDSVIKFKFNGSKKIDGRTKEMKNLFEEEKQVKLFYDPSETLAEKLEKYHTEFFSITNAEKKKVLKNKIDNIENKLIKSKCDEEIARLESIIKNNPLDSNKITKATEQILSIKEKLGKWQKDKLRPFFPWKLHFSEVFDDKHGFDVVITNPPYIKESVNKHAFEGLRNSECYQGKMDLWYLFGSLALDLLRTGGVMCFIATNNWISNDGASKFRDKVVEQGEIINFIDFGGYKVFSAGIQTMVLILVKNVEPSNYTLNYGRLNDEDISLEILDKFLKDDSEIKKEQYSKFRVAFDRSDFKGKYINFIPSRIGRVLNKISDAANFHLDDGEIHSGIDVLQDFVTKRHAEKLGDSASVGDGIFVISDSEKKAIKWNDKELELLKPYFTTKEIKQYTADPQHKHWIIYTGKSINSRINELPNIKKHLDKYQKVLTSVNIPYGLHRTRDENIFLGEKILSIRKCAHPTFSYVNFHSYVSRAFLVIKTQRMNQKYLVSILNSKLVAFWLYHKGKLQGNQYQIDKTPLTSIPILDTHVDKQQCLIQLVDKIIASSKTLESEGNSNTINQINQMVYKLYGLTKKEIKIVEEVGK